MYFKISVYINVHNTDRSQEYNFSSELHQTKKIKQKLAHILVLKSTTYYYTV